VSLKNLVAAAGDRGYRRVSLETGMQDAFAPARTLYRNRGFKICPPFGDYRISTDSVCMTLNLSSP
jgi:putative acetyltransferase